MTGNRLSQIKTPGNRRRIVANGSLGVVALKQERFNENYDD